MNTISTHRSRTHRIGFVSTRFQSTDGVSLETAKWVAVLERLGHRCFYFAGASDRPAGQTYLVPEAHFTHPDIETIYRTAFSQRLRPAPVTRQIQEIKQQLKECLFDFVCTFELEMLVVENALAIPLNLPLGLALTEFIAETGIPTIAHHHDFFWERQRFLTNCVWDYLNMAFPPHLPFIQHVVINSSGANQLSLRTGNSSILIPNVMDFEHPPTPPDSYTDTLRKDLGVAGDELFFLQPTRIVQRKGIEHAIELISRLGIKARLVISHASGDESDDYQQRIAAFADMLRVPISFAADRVSTRRETTADGRRIYTLEDVYPYADLVTYPSTIEGFGNAFLEAVYFRRPLIINNYSIFAIDIRPKGFSVIEFDGYISEETLTRTRQVLRQPALAEAMTEHNYQLGRRYYSYAMLRRRLNMLLMRIFGEDNEYKA